MSIMEKFTESHNQVRALTLSAVLAVGSAVSGCASVSPQQAGRMAAGPCALGGAYVGAKITESSDNPYVKAVGALAGGWAVQDSCRAAAEAAAENAGQCKTVGVYKDGVLVGSNSTCNKSTGVPGDMPVPGR